VGHNHRGGVDSMSHSNGGGVDSVGHSDGGGVDGVGNNGVGNSLRVLGFSGVGHLGDVTVNVVGVVGDSLDTAVRKVDRVRSLNNTGAVVGLGLAESSLGVVIGNSVVVGVGGDLSKVTSGVASRGSMDGVGHSNGSGVDGMSHRGVDGVGNHRGVDGMSQGGSMDGVGQRGSMDGVGQRGSMNGVGQRGSMNGVGQRGVGYSVGNSVVGKRGSVDGMGNRVSHSVGNGNHSSMSHRHGPVGSDGGLDLGETLGVVSLGDGGVGGSEGLGLHEGPLLSVGRGDGLVGRLSTDSVGHTVVGKTMSSYEELRSS